MKKTAIEWLESMLPMVNNNDPYLNIKNILNQAREMEKQRMKEMYSEEEVLEFANWCRIQDNKYPNKVITIQQLFEQFKNK